MWYFTWSLGTLFACAVGMVAAVWVETHSANKNDKENDG